MKKITMLIVFFLAFVTKSHAQFPEGFEGATFPPTGWATFIGANGAGTESNWIQITDFPHTGLASAYVEYEDSGSDNEDWLVTPQFTVSASASALQFSQLQSYEDDYGTSYTIRVSTTTQTDPTAFTIVSSQTETDFGFMDYTDKQVDLSPYIGQSIYVAFVMTNNNGDDWLIDDVDMVSLVAVPGCVTAPSPADLAIDVPYGEITLSWTAPADASATSYDLYAGNSAAELELLGNYTETNTGTDLTIEAYNATVFWKVVAKNAGGDAVGCATWSFTTESAQGFCLNGYQYPDDTYVPVTCDGVTVNEIVDNAYAGEYAVVTVTNGQPYTFLSSVGTDFITISNAAGDTSLASGPTPLTWTSDVAGDVRFFIHADNQCATEAADRVRSIICGSASADFPDFVNLQSPATLTVMQGDSGTVYGQVYVAGVTDPAGQGAGITAWAGVNADNTDPSTWAESSWVPATYNAAATGTG
ncbi:MAG TPA: choice-of-anchor J domain-containing protein, partial [Flavobacterium sp.]|nr:choice-of-anchor J domain-containing protein [Flavobacterium sp.]